MKYYSSYARSVGRRWRRPVARGLRLSTTRLSVRRLRARLWKLLGSLSRCVRNVRLLTRGLVVSSSGGGGGGNNSSPSTGGGRRVLGVWGWGVQDASTGRRAQATAPPSSSCDGTSNGNNGPPRRPPCMRSNSFYQRAVAECLEFIKCSNNSATAAAQAGDDHRK
ncbi:hypothetical protein GUJ93_ZPchr0006g42277 [Zizania palustris]|uniref:Uncharacterized protein n=1 Tax=Zizania palustris TaxID=103762 RepID=A0A8J5VL82_ZIZPA|nr:hypothetical protein GUJ93_ZPchr0006g42277 [Zizania palustris]